MFCCCSCCFAAFIHISTVALMYIAAPGLMVTAYKQAGVTCKHCMPLRVVKSGCCGIIAIHVRLTCHMVRPVTHNDCVPPTKFMSGKHLLTPAV